MEAVVLYTEAQKNDRLAKLIYEAVILFTKAVGKSPPLKMDL
jgi:hypothetical protein